MSNRDYANRRPQSAAKARPARATRRKPTKSAAPRRKLPLALLTFVIVAVGAFGYFLFSIKDNAKQESAPQSKTVKQTETRVKVKEPQSTNIAPNTVPKVKESERQAVALPEPEKTVVVEPKKDPNALPPQPKEEWTYLSELENKHVEVDIPEVVANRTPSQYQLQCASFRQEAQANQMKARIAFQGLEAQVRQVEGTTGTWFKVALGPFNSRRDGERKRHVLQKAGINGCQLLAITP